MKKVILVWSLAVLGMGVATVGSTANANRKPFQDKVRTFQQGNPGTPQERAERLTASMTENLSLTAEQAAKVKEINMSRFTEMQEMRQNAQASSDREAMREQMRTVRTKYDTQLKEVLTQEQYAKYTANQERTGQRGGQREGGSPEKGGKKTRSI